jgi:outer membrane protein TolC
MKIPGLSLFTIAVVTVLHTTPALAQNTKADSARIEALAREAAQKFEQARATAGDQTRPTAPPVPPGTVLELPLDEAVQRALERNLDIAVDRLDPQSFDFSIAALQANYRPTFTSTFGLRSLSTFPRSQTAGASLLTTETLTGNTGLSQNLKWGGGSYAFSFNNNRQAQSDAFATRNPVLNTNFSAAFVQPIMRGFRIDGTRAALQITQLNQKVSEVQLRATIVGTMASVKKAYWALINAIESVKVAEGSLELATKLVEDNRARVEVGTLAPLDVVQAEAEAATRRQALIQAQGARKTAELTLKRLIVSGTEDPYWTATLNPVERPTFSDDTIDVAAAVRTALANRTDLEQAKHELAANDIALKSLTNAQLPGLDLSASYGAAGVGGPQFIRDNTVLGSPVTGVVPSGYSDALRSLTSLDAPQWNVALSLSYPIGASPAEANVARARLQQRQTIAQQRQLELQIATEVTTAAVQVESNRGSLQAAEAALDLAQRRLETEQSRYEVGLSTNFQVVQAQRDLRDAQNAQLGALLGYRQAQVDFERVQQIPSAGSIAITAIAAGNIAAPRATAGGGQ